MAIDILASQWVLTLHWSLHNSSLPEVPPVCPDDLKQMQKDGALWLLRHISRCHLCYIKISIFLLCLWINKLLWKESRQMGLIHTWSRVMNFDCCSPERGSADAVCGDQHFPLILFHYDFGSMNRNHWGLVLIIGDWIVANEIILIE